MQSFLDFITRPISKLITFMFNIMLSSFLINLLVLQSTDAGVFKLEMLRKSQILIWIILYLIIFFIYLIYSYKREEKMAKEYIDTCTTRQIKAKVEKEKIKIVADKYNEFAQGCKTPEELEKVQGTNI